MNVYKWLLIGWFLFSAVVMVGTIGKHRRPIDSGTAGLAILVDALLILLVVLA